MQNNIPSGLLRNLRETFELLRKRRNMYINDSFDSLVAFIVGYSEATRQASGIDLMQLLQDYVKKSYETEFAILWPYYLMIEVSDGDMEESTKLVFSVIDDFILNNNIQDP